LGYFKEAEKHPFTLIHCWLKLKDYPKWTESFEAWYKDGGHSKRSTKESTIDLDEDGSPRKTEASGPAKWPQS
jgi:hypothetical protein